MLRSRIIKVKIIVKEEKNVLQNNPVHFFAKKSKIKGLKCSPLIRIKSLNAFYSLMKSQSQSNQGSTK